VVFVHLISNASDDKSLDTVFNIVAGIEMGFFDIFKGKTRRKEVREAYEDAPADFPKFKYHQNPFLWDFKTDDAPCPCCGKVTGYIHEHTAIHEEEIENICPWCIADGSAAEKFGCVFNDVSDIDGIPPERIDELTRRTPGLSTWQDLDWPTHCNDFYSFVDYVIWPKIKQMGIEKEIEQDLSENDSDFSVKEIKKGLHATSSMRGYLFRCLHCGKYHLHVDLD